MEKPKKIAIQLVYADTKREVLLDCVVDEGTTIQDAILQSHITQHVPDVDVSQLAVGIYGKKKMLDTPVREHDRIEFYRPLVADPKDSRRKRVDDNRKKAAAKKS